MLSTAGGIRWNQFKGWVVVLIGSTTLALPPNSRFYPWGYKVFYSTLAPLYALTRYPLGEIPPSLLKSVLCSLISFTFFALPSHFVLFSSPRSETFTQWIHNFRGKRAFMIIRRLWTLTDFQRHFDVRIAELSGDNNYNPSNGEFLVARFFSLLDTSKSQKSDTLPSHFPHNFPSPANNSRKSSK